MGCHSKEVTVLQRIYGINISLPADFMPKISSVYQRGLFFLFESNQILVHFLDLKAKC